MALFIGLMSGTSLDGVDAVLAEFSQHGAPKSLAHRHTGFNTELVRELLALNQAAENELHRAALASNGLMQAYAGVVAGVLRDAGVASSAVRAVAAHGQTVRHRPGEFDGLGYTLQLMNGALLAEACDIDVICDFRRRDMAAGGQGAPLVPAFHQAVFARAGTSLAVLNIGGMANLTLLPAGGAVGGFDCGPGNALMDAWCLRHTGAAFDAAGQWAASGQINAALLRRLLADPFFQRQPPKSTGRDLFNTKWLDAALAGEPQVAADVQATLAELTACSAAQALNAHAAGTQELLVCGGGAFNAHLMRRLATLLPGVQVASTATRGVPPDQVEALAFAWLGWAFTTRRAGNLAAVTGARGPRVLGALYPAR